MPSRGEACGTLCVVTSHSANGTEPDPAMRPPIPRPYGRARIDGRPITRNLPAGQYNTHARPTMSSGRNGPSVRLSVLSGSLSPRSQYSPSSSPSRSATRLIIRIPGRAGCRASTISPTNGSSIEYASRSNSTRSPGESVGTMLRPRTTIRFAIRKAITQ